MVCASASAGAGDECWPTWRGPQATGVALKGNPPVTWSESENVRWKIDLPGIGTSSPIIWGNKMFFLTAVDTGKKGQPASEPPSPQDDGGARPRGPGRSQAPTTVFAFDLVCLDRTTGKTLWQKIATKAVPHEGHHPDHGFAFNKETGQPLWRKDRDEATSWATPVSIEVDGKTQVITNATNFIRSYDAQTGEIIWQCSGQTKNAIPSPVLGFGKVFCTSGFRGSALQAIQLGRTGDLSGSDAIVWQVNEATPYVPSPVLHDGRIYVCSVNNEVISCYDAQTGKPHYTRQRLEGVKGVYASPVAVADRVYFAGRNGVTAAIKSAHAFEVLATNTLDDGFDASAAIVGDALYLKGRKHLYCLMNP